MLELGNLVVREVLPEKVSRGQRCEGCEGVSYAGVWDEVPEEVAQVCLGGQCGGVTSAALITPGFLGCHKWPLGFLTSSEQRSAKCVCFNTQGEADIRRTVKKYYESPDDRSGRWQ